MVKLLFLDVDGVINVPGRGMDRRLLSNLRGIIDETNCKIVLSSDWRCTAATRNEIRGILRAFGMDYISCTPPSRSPFQARRPEEIIAWIHEHNGRVDSGNGELSGLGKVEQWVAIDDRPLLSEPSGTHMRGHFVQTSLVNGLTAEKAQMAKRILMGSSSSGSAVASDDMGVPGVNTQKLPFGALTPMTPATPQQRPASLPSGSWRAQAKMSSLAPRRGGSLRRP
mmetsp:Transcript_33376/g.92314  ORF Transcript_33376/g.92314 Transcript_33376/m.92314 type:complete len:225 (-) Transcript_33376:170-844(-)